MIYIEPVIAVVTVSASVAQVSTVIAQANPNRKFFLLYNNASNSAYITYGSSSSGASCSAIVAGFSNYSAPYGINYTGPLAAIRNAGSGTIVLTEFISAA
jgi:hypothetical protein